LLALLFERVRYRLFGLSLSDPFSLFALVSLFSFCRYLAILKKSVMCSHQFPHYSDRPGSRRANKWRLNRRPSLTMAETPLFTRALQYRSPTVSSRSIENTKGSFVFAFSATNPAIRKFSPHTGAAWDQLVTDLHVLG